jgi:hypothetical protein
MITTILYGLGLLLILFFILVLYLGVKYIRTRHYALVPNNNNKDDVYIQFL